MWRRRNNRLALAVSPVDDIPAFVRGIDFGTTTVRGDEIDVILSPEFVASVPRLPPGALRYSQVQERRDRADCGASDATGRR